MKTSRVVGLLLAMGLGALAGCVGSGDFVALVPLANGEKVQVPMSAHAPAFVKNDDAEVTKGTFDLQADAHTLTYHFGFRLLKPADVRHVQVVDMAGDRPVVLVDDPAPKLAGRQWQMNAEPWPANDPRIQWLYTVENSIRIYRFTIELADGRRLVLDQPEMVPAFAKQGIRHQLGADY